MLCDFLKRVNPSSSPHQTRLVVVRESQTNNSLDVWIVRRRRRAVRIKIKSDNCNFSLYFCYIYVSVFSLCDFMANNVRYLLANINNLFVFHKIYNAALFTNHYFLLFNQIMVSIMRNCVQGSCVFTYFTGK